MLKHRLPRPALPLLPLLVLLTSCATDSTLYVPPAHQPAIPPLPAQARQTASPQHSANAQTDIEQWLQSLTQPSSPDTPASGPTPH